MDKKAWIIAVIIALVLLLVLIGVLFYAFQKIRSRIRYYCRMLFGTNTVSGGIRKMEAEYSETPKSVSAATSLYLPKITKDFPEFHYEEARERAENVLISYLRSVDSYNCGLLTEGSNELKDKLMQKIQMLKSEGTKEHFQNIKIHRTEIAQYRKTKGRCSIVFQSAMESVHFAEKGGSIIRGRNDRREQSKYNVEMIYIQDREQIENLGDRGLALNCPNCGAPIQSIGMKTCQYCDSPVMEFNICTWNFSDVREVR